jgi:hypothetical protein
MTHTFFRDNHAEIVKNQAYGYMPTDRGKFELRVPNFDTVGATSLLTTVEDFARWDANFDQPKIAPKVIAKMQERGQLSSGAPIDYAFGLTPGVYRGLAFTGHGGSDAGYKADYLRFPRERLAVACECNLGTVVPRDLTKKVAEVFLGDRMAPAEKPAAPASAGAGIPAGAPGLYYNRDLGDVRRILERDGRLVLYSPGPRNEMLAVTAAGELQILGPIGVVGKVSLAAGRITESRPGAAPVIYERRREFQPNNLAGYAGSYRSAELDVPYQIFVLEGKLWLKRIKLSPSLLTPTFEDCFLTPSNNGEAHLEFERNTQGRVTAFVLNIGRVRHLRFRQ